MQKISGLIEILQILSEIDLKNPTASRYLLHLLRDPFKSYGEIARQFHVRRQYVWLVIKRVRKKYETIDSLLTLREIRRSKKGEKR